MSKKFGVVMSSITQINPLNDSNLALMLEAKHRGWDVFYMESTDLFALDHKVFANVKKLDVFDDQDKWFDVLEAQTIALAELDVIFLRIDPPFDMNYLYTTQLLDLVEQQGTRVVNKPQSVRDFNEKLMTLYFPDCCAPMLVSDNKKSLVEFYQQHNNIILKPLDGHAGENVFHVDEQGKNLNTIIEILTAKGTRQVIAQRFIPEIKNGDKRILIIDGEPVPYSFTRYPSAGEIRSNIAAGGSGKTQPLSERDLTICARLAPMLKAKKLLFVGIDVIGDYLTEVNLTSPTCIRQIERETGLTICADILDRCFN